MDERTQVTHLFTDLEGSTRLWESAGERMASALVRHDYAARKAIDAHGGRLVKSTGDGVHAVFADAVEAIRAAADFQLEMLALARDLSLPLQARCGIHLGVASERDGDYFGPAVNRAARIMSAAHGGQILLSDAVMRETAERLPREFSLLELGRVRLRDLAAAEPVHQLLHASLPRAFPALRSLETAPNNLPLQPTRFVGRHGAVAELGAALRANRLVTIIGPGGIGKTRLALQIAADALDAFADGVWFVDLAPVAEGSMIAGRVADVLGAKPAPNETFEQSVHGFLAKRTCLVVLDNCEQVVEAAARFAQAVIESSAATIIATSREALRAPGEVVYALPPLALPPSGERAEPDRSTVLRYPAVALFVERVRARAGDFPLSPTNIDTVVRICRRLDGIPLALELAAGRLPALSLDELERRLDDRLRLLRGGSRTAAARHQTLEALVRWSYDLLGHDEKIAFLRLSQFAGAFDLEAARTVCGHAPLDCAEWLDVVASLVDKSLLVPVTSVGDEGAMRYRMLETLRAFAQAQLDSAGDAREMMLRHARWLVSEAKPGPDRRRSPAAVFDRLDTLRDDYLAALAGTLQAAACAGEHIELALALVDYWHARGRFSEARAALERALALPGLDARSKNHAMLSFELAQTAFYQSDLEGASRLALPALEAFGRLGETALQGSVLDVIGKVCNTAGDSTGARAAFQLAIDCFRACGRRDSEAKELLNLSHTYFKEGAIDQAIACTRAALTLGREAGVEKLEAYAESNLANFEYEAGRAEAALAHCDRARRLARDAGDRYVESLMEALSAELLLERGHRDAALRMLASALDWCAANNRQRDICNLLDTFAHACATGGHVDDAVRLYAFAERGRADAGIALSMTEEARREQRIAALRDRLGDAFADRSAEGAAWTRDAAIERALLMAHAASETPKADFARGG